MLHNKFYMYNNIIYMYVYIPILLVLFLWRSRSNTDIVGGRIRVLDRVPLGALLIFLVNLSSTPPPDKPSAMFILLLWWSFPKTFPNLI